MSAENQAVRAELTETQVTLVVQMIDNLFNGTIRTPEQLEVAADVLEVAAAMCKKASEIHRGLQVPWASMCWAARLPAASGKLKTTQTMVERMLAPLFVDVIRQENPRRGCAMPNFKAAKA